MSKSIKLTENNYIDSSGVVHKRTTLDKMFNGESSIGNIIIDDINSKNLYDSSLVTINNNNYYFEYEIDNTKPYVFQSPYDWTLVYGIDASGNETRAVYETGKTQDSRVVTFVPNSNEVKIKCGFYTTNFKGFNGVQLEQNNVATNYSNYIDFNALKGVSWNDIALINTYNYYDATTYNKLQYKKVSNEVFIRGMLTNSVANPLGYYATCGTLPEECRPRKITYLIADETGEVCDCVIQPNGEIRVYNKKANNWISLDSIRFFID